MWHCSQTWSLSDSSADYLWCRESWETQWLLLTLFYRIKIPQQRPSFITNEMKTFLALYFKCCCACQEQKERLLLTLSSMLDKRNSSSCRGFILSKNRLNVTWWWRIGLSHLCVLVCILKSLIPQSSLTDVHYVVQPGNPETKLNKSSSLCLKTRLLI